MRKVLVIINNSLHALTGTAAFLFVIYALLRGEQFGFIGALILILSIPLMILGIGVFIRPEPMQKAMLGFHLLWVALSVIWSLYLWYILSTNQGGGWGGLVYYLISIGIYSVTILSVMTILLFTSVSQVFTAPFRFVKSSSMAALREWVSWKRTLSAVVIVLVGFGIYAAYHSQSIEWKSREIEDAKKDTKTGESKLFLFLNEWKKVLKEMEVYVPGEVPNTQTDHWETPYRIMHATPRLQNHYKYSASIEITSAGPDALFDSLDDLQIRAFVYDIRRNKRGTYNYIHWDDSSDMLLLDELAKDRAVIYPHDVESSVGGSYELLIKDKWERNVRVVYSSQNSDATVTAYSAGLDGAYDTADDLFVTKTREPIASDTIYQRFEKYVTDSKTTQARQNVFDLVKTAAIENTGLEQAATGYYSSRKPRVLNDTDNWGRPLELYHAHPDRSAVYVYSYGEDGLRGNLDDLVYVAVDKSYSDLLKRVKKNIIPPAARAPGLVFFEVSPTAGRADKSIDVTLDTTNSKSSQQSLRAKFPAFYLASTQGGTCRADLRELVTQPPTCCAKSNPATIAGRYQLQAECLIEQRSRAFVAMPERIEMLDPRNAQILTGEQLHASFPLAFLFESCQFQRLDSVEIYYCRQADTFARGRSWSWHSKAPHRTFLYVGDELVFAQADYLAVMPGLDGYTHEDNYRPEFTAYYRYQGKTYYLLASGASIFKNDDGQWRIAKRTPKKYYGECACAN